MRNAWVFGVLYFSEGAPIGFLWWALPTLLRTQGMPIERITALTALLVLPWTLKFLAAPLVDVVRSPSWGLKHWASTAQIGMGLCLLPLLKLDPLDHPRWWVGLLMAHAVCAALQDVGIDALAIASVPASARGTVNAWMQVGMLGGRGLFGGGSIWLAAQWGLSGVMGALIVAIWVSLLILWRFVKEPEDSSSGSSGFGAALKSALAHRQTWWGLGFALTAGAAFEATGGVAGPMLVDSNVDQKTVATFFGVGVVAAMMLGSIVGGRWADGRSRLEAVGGALAVTTALVLLVSALLFVEAPTWVLTTGLAMVYLASGVLVASSYALFMDLTDPRLGATQFSTFMAATNGCEAWAVVYAGSLASAHGYAQALATMSGLGLVGFVFLWLLSRSGVPQTKV